MRTAEAAKNTSTLIENVIMKVGNGFDLVGATSEALTEASVRVTKVGTWWKRSPRPPTRRPRHRTGE